MARYIYGLLLAMFLLSACGEVPAEVVVPPDPPPPQEDVSGTWTGQGSLASGSSFGLTLQLSSSGASVSGTATLTGNVTGETTLIGSLSGGNLSLSAESLALDAALSGGAMSGSGTLRFTDGSSGAFNFTLTRGSTPPIKEPPPEGVSITGTVTAPAGGDVSGTNIAACLNGECENAVATTITQSGSSANYALSGLQTGASYSVVAFKDMNGNGVFDEGDYGGQSPDLVSPPTTVDIQLSVNGGDGGGGGALGQALLGTWEGFAGEISGYKSTVITLTIDTIVEASDEGVLFRGVMQMIGDYSDYATIEGSYDETGQLYIIGGGGAFSVEAAVDDIMMVGALYTLEADVDTGVPYTFYFTLAKVY